MSSFVGHNAQPATDNPFAAHESLPSAAADQLGTSNKWFADAPNHPRSWHLDGKQQLQPTSWLADSPETQGSSFATASTLTHSDGEIRSLGSASLGWSPLDSKLDGQQSLPIQSLSMHDSDMGRAILGGGRMLDSDQEHGHPQYPNGLAPEPSAILSKMSPVFRERLLGSSGENQFPPRGAQFRGGAPLRPRGGAPPYNLQRATPTMLTLQRFTAEERFASSTLQPQDRGPDSLPDPARAPVREFPVYDLDPGMDLRPRGYSGGAPVDPPGTRYTYLGPGDDKPGKPLPQQQQQLHESPYYPGDAHRDGRYQQQGQVSGPNTLYAQGAPYGTPNNRVMPYMPAAYPQLRYHQYPAQYAEMLPGRQMLAQPQRGWQQQAGPYQRPQFSPLPQAYPSAGDYAPRGMPPTGNAYYVYPAQTHPPQQQQQQAQGQVQAVERSPEAMESFRDRQWQLLRVFAIRRLSREAKRKEGCELTQANCKTAFDMFKIPTVVAELVSRPHKYRDDRQADGMGQQLPDAFSPGDEVDLCTPNDVRITEEDLTILNSSSLPEDALGWWPMEMGDDALGGDSSDSGGSESRQAGDEPPGNGPASGGGPAEAGTVPAVDDDTQQRFAAAAMAAMAAELVARRRYKTKLCHAYLRTGGHCPRGSNCDYAHGTQELRIFQEPSDGRYKTKLCRVWLDSCGSFCPHADRCSFAHGVQELRVRLPGTPVSGADDTEPKVAPRDSVTSSPGSAYGVSHYSPSGGVRRFKPHLCRAWLQSAANASAVAAANFVRFGTSSDGAKERYRGEKDVKHRCPKGESCPHAHGLAELRLASQQEQTKLINALLCESPATYLANVGSVEPGLTLRDQTLLFIASGLLGASLPPPLLLKVTSAAAMASRTRDPSGRDQIDIAPEFEGIPPPLARALTAAVHNPMLQVVLPAADIAAMNETALHMAAVGGFQQSPLLAGHYRDGSQQPPAQQRAGLARVIATVGNEAADASVITAAVALGVIRITVPLPMGKSPQFAGDTSSAAFIPDNMISGATGRYGALMRRRIELQSAVSQAVGDGSGSHPGYLQ